MEIQSMTRVAGWAAFPWSRRSLCPLDMGSWTVRELSPGTWPRVTYHLSQLTFPSLSFLYCRVLPPSQYPALLLLLFFLGFLTSTVTETM